MVLRVRLARQLRRVAVASICVVAASAVAAPPALAGGGSTPVATGSSTQAWARAADVGALAVAGSSLSTGVHPDGMRFLAVSVRIGPGRWQVFLTNATTPEELLRALGVRVGAHDLVRPRRQGPLAEGARVRVIRIRTVVRTFTEQIAFSTVARTSSSLGPGQTRIENPGSQGLALRTYRISYRNGRETGRRLLTEQVLTAPVTQVVLQGASSSGHGRMTGQASWYARSGMCAANLTLPKGTVVQVTNLDNGRSVTVIIDDRGPYGVPGRIIDLCQTAFAQIAPLGQGVANVAVTW